MSSSSEQTLSCPQGFYARAIECIGTPDQYAREANYEITVEPVSAVDRIKFIYKRAT
jgi:hypothetical protein